jgi:UDP:flavonoid glycosyltransferase YjiC (YdhE family)
MLTVRKAGKAPYKAIFNLARMATAHWWRPVRDLRIAEGLRPSCDPLMKDKFSPDLVLALFSTWLAQAQPDWPKQTFQPGFLFHDGAAPADELQPEIKRHIESHGPPVVFTLGSTAVSYPGDFYRTSIEAAKRLGTSGILIGATAKAERVTNKILSVPYIPYSRIFPEASVIAHQGGSGTTGQALKAGRPMLFVPWGWDQPDNALRAVLRGSALSIRKDQYSIDTAVAALDRLKTDPSFAQSARAAAEHVRKEAGLAEAANQIMSMLNRDASRVIARRSDWV